MKIVLDKKKTVAVIIIVSFIIAYMAGFLFNNQFSLIDAQLNDHFFRLRYMMKKNEAIDHRIVLIAIGDSVFQDRNIPVWDRRIFGKLIDILADAGAASIGIDIVFQDKSYVENDDSLIQAVKNAKNVLSPVILNPSSDKIQENHADEIPGLLVQPHIVVQGDPVIAREDILPFKELLCYSHSLGHINCDADNDGMNRKFPLLIRDGKNKNAYYPGLAFRMVYEHLGVQPDTIDVYFGKKIVLKNAHISGNKIEDIEIPIDHKGRMILNWAGPWYGNTFPNYSVERLLKAANDPVELLKLKKTLEGALVIVANVSTPNNDHGPGVFEKVYPLSGVHLNVANSILTGNFMKFPGVFDKCIVTGIVVLLLLFLSVRLKLFHLLLSYIGLFLLFWAVNFFIFFLFNRLAGPAIPSAGFFLSFIFVFAYRFIAEERERITLQAIKENERFQKEFLEDMAHELKTPLTLILGPLEALIEDPHTNNEDKINIIGRNAQKLLYLINQVLQLSKLEAGNTVLSFRPIDIVQVLNQKLNNFGYLLNKKEIKCKFINRNNSGLVVYADINKLDMVFNNILLNAYTYTQEKGRVEIEVSPSLPVNSIMIEKNWPGKIPENMVIIKITDTGIGIPQEEILRIFERNRQVENSKTGSHNGSGIGLYLAKKYIEFHYGNIEAKSEPGRGSEFIITLPLGKGHLKKDEIAGGGTTGSSALLNINQDTGTMVNTMNQNFDDILAIYSRELEKNLVKQQEKQTVRKKRNFSNGTILIVEDDPDMRLFIKGVLEDYYDIVEAVNGTDGLEKAKKMKPDLVLSDIRMPEMDGIQLLTEIRQNKSLSHIPVIFITVNEFTDVRLRNGMLEPEEYLAKPFSPGILLSRVKNILVLKNQQEKIEDIKKLLMLKQPEIFSDIITDNIKMKAIFKQIEIIASSLQPVLITGETGVGKELVAKTIHAASNVKGKYIFTNIAATGDNLLPSILFGHVKGAFTDAADKDGLIKAAEEGTLFLDEIGDMSYEAQKSLLRVLDPGDYQKVGSNEIVQCKARIIAATNKDINTLMNEGKFKYDLFNRFMHIIHIPPLRERRDDVVLLLKYFFKQAAEEYKKPIPEIPMEVLHLLRDYSFPDNIRDLKRMVYETVTDIHYNGEVNLSVFKLYMKKNPGNLDKEEDIIHPGSTKTITFTGGFFTLDEVIEIYIKEVLRKTNNVEIAAGILGRETSVIYKRINKYKNHR